MIAEGTAIQSMVLKIAELRSLLERQLLGPTPH